MKSMKSIFTTGAVNGNGNIDGVLEETGFEELELVELDHKGNVFNTFTAYVLKNPISRKAYYDSIPSDEMDDGHYKGWMLATDFFSKYEISSTGRNIDGIGVARPAKFMMIYLPNTELHHGRIAFQRNGDAVHYLTYDGMVKRLNRDSGATVDYGKAKMTILDETTGDKIPYNDKKLSYKLASILDILCQTPVRRYGVFTQ